MPDHQITLVCERPEYNEYSINGVKLECHNIKDFWIDIAFKKMPIPKEALRIGKNTVTVKTLYKWSTHLESLYLVGDFGVVAGVKKSVLTKSLPEIMQMTSYAEQSMPFYSGNVTLKLPYDKYKDHAELKEGERLYLSVKSYGAAVRACDGAALDEIIAWEPYEVDITSSAKEKRDLEITVLGTRKNTFGPLHTKECVVHRCGHGSFTTSGDDWVDEYNLLRDGIREIRFTVQK